jgi:hypothetical protein
MKKSAYGKPLIIKDKSVNSINRIEEFDELTIQDLVFNYPECIPVSDIDESYNPIIPVCTELRTPVGPLDIFMITPNGDIVIIETKLFRNPEARRKVIAQILDYANEISKWKYEDLQREVNIRLARKKNTLYNIAYESYSELTLSESDFVDAVSRNLSRGKFLLLIVGDGIKEGASSIVEFLSNSGNTNFTFGMIELAVYDLGNEGRIILPRTIVRTVDIQKFSIELPDGFTISNTVVSNNNNNEKDISPETLEIRHFFKKFWAEFLENLEIDDPGQPLPNLSKTQNLYLYPGKNKYCWISAYFSQSRSKVGVYLRFQNDQNGHRIAEGLWQFEEELREELGSEVTWSWNEVLKNGFSVALDIKDVYSENNRTKIVEFLAVWMNRFVNAIRPRLKEIE